MVLDAVQTAQIPWSLTRCVVQVWKGLWWSSSMAWKPPPPTGWTTWSTRVWPTCWLMAALMSGWEMSVAICTPQTTPNSNLTRKNSGHGGLFVYNYSVLQVNPWGSCNVGWATCATFPHTCTYSHTCILYMYTNVVLQTLGILLFRNGVSCH